jgi:6,7-dimethyl-8-ribityllumazine synthase
MRRGQQIRCDPEADGKVRLENGSIKFGSDCAAGAAAAHPCALIRSFSREETNMSQRATQPSASQDRIALVQSCWHKDIVDRARQSFLDEIVRLGRARNSIDVFEVPGAFEIPLQAKLLAKTGRYAAIVACGFVVDGGIYRHEFVADAVIKALMQVQLETEIPVLSVVLTPQRFHEHDEHQKFFREHFVVKGAEAAAACDRILGSVAQLKVG